MTDDLRYPIGRFSKPEKLTDGERAACVERIRALPLRLRDAVRGLSTEQLETRYRDEGWTVRQVVHHLGDSHINCLVRFKLGLTELTPLIKTYDENLWLETADARTESVDNLLSFVAALHMRLDAVVSGIDSQSGSRVIEHPESGLWTLDQLLAMYAWHGDHHVAHITSLRSRRGW